MVRHVGLEAEWMRDYVTRVPEGWSCAGCGTTNTRTATLGCKKCSDRLRKRREREYVPCPGCGAPMLSESTRCKDCYSLEMRQRTHCPRGHPYDEENTYLTQRGHRGCRACRRGRRFAWTRTRSKG